VPADPADLPGTLSAPVAAPPSGGRGDGGGAGSGTGTGLGEGRGAGIGPGSGGGTGGGLFRPGTGIEPPQLLREVKPDYTEEARRQSIEGDVKLEIVVRHDGSVGDVHVLHSLGAGLEQKAVDAVRQWRFSPAHREGQPVDVLVQVSVEFSLR
jgi:periplasmic protein TonB